MLRVNPEVAKELKGGNGRWLTEMEELIGRPVLVKGDAQLHQENSTSSRHGRGVAS